MSIDNEFEPDWNSYYKMDDEERQVRKERYKIFMKYSNGKITHEQYIEEMDNPYFYGVLTKDEWSEVTKLHEEKKGEFQKQQNMSKSLARQNSDDEARKFFRFVSLIFLIILILWGIFK